MAKKPAAKRRKAPAIGRAAARLRIRLRRERNSLALASLGVLMLLASCATPRVAETPSHSLALVATDFAALPGWNADHLAEAIPAFNNSCAAFARWPDDKPLGGDAYAGHAADWRPACAAAALVQPGDDTAAAKFLAAYFQPYLALDRGAETGLFTGYYETEVEGSRKPGGLYTVPLYRAPAAPVSFTRAEIDAGALKGKGLELIWLKDPVDAFILQIQGSGLVKLTDGSLTRVGYAGNNGQDFVGVAKLMIQAGLIPKDQASMQSVRAWLKAHPAEAKGWMEKNPRFIFFRELDASGGLPPGPAGALGVTLTPTRSMAVDPGFLPLGIPVWLDTRSPDGTPLQRLMLAQDVGSAIKGPVRGDLFWGTGEPALDFAGRMKSGGRYYVLLPKAVAARSTFTVTELNTDQ
ncbi:MAG TPA: MltA domain-containing protein [Candidatus Cybelea sp.]|nr:MltA domain-containing protein [Candidatus Cybelea sp.]